MAEDILPVFLSLAEIKTVLFDDYLAKAVPIPEPEFPKKNEDKQFSGQILFDKI